MRGESIKEEGSQVIIERKESASFNHGSNWQATSVTSIMLMKERILNDALEDTASVGHRYQFLSGYVFLSQDAREGASDCFVLFERKFALSSHAFSQCFEIEDKQSFPRILIHDLKERRVKMKR